MKIEQLVVQHLYNARQLSLQGIGVFKLRPDVILPAEGDKDFSMPADAFSFDYNLKATEDEAMVDFIVQQTRKIRPLASSDLDSYAILAKQFLNLGKPFIIEGVGTIQKNQSGKYEFIAGNFITQKVDDVPKQLKEKKETEISFESEEAPRLKNKRLIAFVSVAGVILAGLLLYYFLVLKDRTDTVTPAEPPAAIAVPADTVKKDTSLMAAVKPDTSAAKHDSNTAVTVPAATTQPTAADGSTFKIVLKEYPSEPSAKRAFVRLSSYGHKLAIITSDSIKYKLAMPFSTPLSDTLRAKDSLRKFFGGKPYVQL